MMIKHAEFFTGQGAKEDFFSAMSQTGDDFVSEFTALLKEYDDALSAFGCSRETEMLLRIHLSDVTNQQPFVEKMLDDRQAFIPIIGQSPAGSSRIALEAWHWSGAAKQKTGNSLEVKLQNYTVNWFSLSDGEMDDKGSYDQTYREFCALKEHLAGYDAVIADHTVRTWLYCRDVDNNYAGLVQARNHFFGQNGLAGDTHFIASTGIEGQSGRPDRLVRMDSINYPGLRPGQMQYLYALDNLSPTALYGVSFERGTRLVLGDRSHDFISGTASIDREGKIVYPFDVKKQAGRVMENIAALLKEADAGMSDVKSATVYLRDLADYKLVLPEIRKFWDESLPMVVLQAPVCRPGWLVEIECIAVNAKGNIAYPVFG